MPTNDPHLDTEVEKRLDSYLDFEYGLVDQSVIDSFKFFMATEIENAKHQRDKEWEKGFDDIAEDYGGWVPLKLVKKSIMETLTQQDTTKEQV